ncbi:ATP-binding response regulator [Paraburkholderia ginsengisoli]|uniref:histidine kinase n=1 Tax=Paraburkholderia ginsengisoli TaxID=311231 RepID=A0A7T4N9S5_9BURK|nr:hybrid sensor histidine kinase/response regulator [Paraburkholderia ginsengisoli]QQC67867.1 response regulator [Paraburkholderia ginsengisoli]
MTFLRRLGVKRALGVAIALLFCASGIWVYFAYSLLLSPASLKALAGPQENYYWPVAQLEIAANKAKNCLFLYGAGRADFRSVQLRFDVLQSKYAVLATPSDATQIFSGNATFRDAIAKIGAVIEKARPAVEQLPQDPHKSIDLSFLLAEIDDPLAVIADRVSEAEIERRDRVYDDLISKRYLFFISSLGLLVILACIVALAVMLGVDRRRLTFQQRAAMKAERDAARAKNAFLGMIGHELRTPLQSIVSVTDTLLERRFAERDATLIKRLAVAAGRLETQMKDLTDFARLEAGGLTLREREFQPATVIGSTIDDVMASAEGKGLEVVASVVNGGGWYLSDPDRIGQIVGNLLSNAVKYTDAGRISVRLDVKPSKSGAILDISVEDTGPGIPAASVGYIFQPFTQLDQSNTRTNDGAGIGLTIVKGLVDLLGGLINIETEPGRGTKVSVSLPVKAAAAATEADDTELEITAIIERKRVLIVDDQESARESFADVLSSFGAHVDVAGDAGEALAALGETTYDAVLLDVQMPGEDGIAVARKVRATAGSNRDVPIIGISAFSRELLEDSGAALFTQHLHKPVRNSVLKQALLDVFAAGKPT